MYSSLVNPLGGLHLGLVQYVVDQVRVPFADAIVTSPPYYGARRYGGDCVGVWGGDPAHVHEWVPCQLPPTKMSRVGSTETEKHMKEVRRRGGVTENYVCQCGAYMGELGQEPTVGMYVEHMVQLARQWRARVLKPSGVFWLNLDDTYDGYENRRSMLGVPWAVALGLIADGWRLRCDVVLNKRNVKPDGARNRPTRAHEYLFMFSTDERHYWNAEAAQEPTVDGEGTRNIRSVWDTFVGRGTGGHTATFPTGLVACCLRMSVPPGGVVFDPFGGEGDTAVAAQSLGMRFMLVEACAAYYETAVDRLSELAEG